MSIDFEDKNITQFMGDIKKYFEPISHLVNFKGIESYLYSETIGDVDEDNLTMDFIFTLIDFMLDSQSRTKEETIELYKVIKNYLDKCLGNLKLQKLIVEKRIKILNEKE